MDNQTLHAAVRVLYLSDEPHPVKKQADTWLTQFMETDEAWNAMFSILQGQWDEPILFYAASGLFTKIRNHWPTLVQTSDMPAKLINLVLLHAESPNPIRRKISQACAATAIRTVPHFWPNLWQDLLLPFQPGNQAASTAMREAFLMIICNLVDQLPNRSLPSEQVQQVKAVLLEGVPLVLGVINQLFSDLTTPTSCKKIAIECLTQWAKFGMTLRHLVECGTIQNLCSVLHDPNFLSGVCEALGVIFAENGAEKSPPTSQDGMHNQALFGASMNVVLSLREIYSKALAGGASDVCRSITNLANDFGVSNKILLARGLEAPGNKEFLAFLLTCTANPEKDIAECCLEFWYFLSTSCTDQAVFRGLLEVLLVQCTYSQDLTFEDEEELDCMKSFRSMASRAIRSTNQILKGAFWEVIDAKLKEARTWNTFEACLHFIAVTGVMLERSPENSLFVAGYIRIGCQLPEHPILNKTILKLINKFAACLVDVQDLLPAAVNKALSNLLSEGMTRAACKATCSLCVECKKIPGWDVQKLVIASNQRFNEEQEDEKKILLKGIIQIVYTLQQSEHILFSIQQLIVPIIERVNQLLVQPPNEATKKALITQLGNFKALLMDQAYPHPGSHPNLLLVQALWSIEDRLRAQWNLTTDPDLEVLKVVYGFYKSCISKTSGLEPLLEQFIKNIVEGFANYPAAFYLDTSQSLIAMFTADQKDENIIRLIEGMLRSFTTLVISLVSQGQAGSFADTIGSYFVTLHQSILFNPFIVLYGLEQSVFALSVQIGCSCFGVPSDELIKSISYYLEDILFSEKLNQLENWKIAISNVVASQGSTLIHVLLSTAVTDGTFKNIPRVGNILCSIVQHQPSLHNAFLIPMKSNFPQWTDQQINFATQLLLRQHRQRFIKVLTTLNGIFHNKAHYDALQTYTNQIGIDLLN